MARKPGEKLPTDPGQLDGLTKAAILLMSLETSAASHLLKQLGPEQIEEVTRELAGLGRVTPELRNAVIEEFYSL